MCPIKNLAVMWKIWRWQVSCFIIMKLTAELFTSHPVTCCISLYFSWPPSVWLMWKNKQTTCFELYQDSKASLYLRISHLCLSELSKFRYKIYVSAMCIQYLALSSLKILQFSKVYIANQCTISCHALSRFWNHHFGQELESHQLLQNQIK